MADYNIDFKLVKTMSEAFSEEADDCEKTQKLVDTSVGATKDAHSLIYKDHLWRLTNKIFKLYLYVSGSQDFEPLLREEMRKVQEEQTKPQTD